MDTIETGYLAGPVTIKYTRKGLRFPPSDVSLWDPGVFKYHVDEEIVLKASQAELTTAALRLSMGLDSADLSTVSGSASYNPASWDPATSSTSYDIIRLGHNEIGTTGYQTLVFEHEVPGTDKTVTLVLYRAFCRAKFDMVFDKRYIVLQDCEWYGMVNNSRSAGDRVGMILIQE